MSKPQGSTQDFIQAVYNGDPITGKVLSALATGDPDKINTLLDSSGYDVQSEGLQKALKSADPGSDFDLSVGKAIRSFGKFTD